MSKADLTDEQCVALEEAKQKFAEWRENKTGRERIPDSLWSTAADLFHSFGLPVNKIARSLRLNYSTLKTHIAEKSSTIPKSTEETSATFVELPTPQAYSDCVIEMENQSGVKMRMCFRGPVDPVAVELGRHFFEGQP